MGSTGKCRAGRQRPSGFEDRKIEITESEQRETKQKKEQNLRDLWDHHKRPHISVISITHRKGGSEKLLKLPPKTEAYRFKDLNELFTK